MVNDLPCSSMKSALKILVNAIVLGVVVSTLTLPAYLSADVSHEANRAIRSGDFKKAASLLRESANDGDPEAQYRLATLYRDGRGLNQSEPKALFWLKRAASQGHARSCFTLADWLERGRGTKIDLAAARTHFECAERGGDGRATDRLKSLDAHGGSGWAASDGDRKSALVRGVRGGNVSLVRQSLAAGASPNTRDSHGATVLLLAAERDSGEVAELLLEAGAQTDSIDPSGRTALMIAAGRGHAEIAERLLAHGAEINTQGPGGRTALMIGARKGQEKIVKAFVRAGATTGL
ncbi:MAG: ankyrin repeat domain-containing protein, partial [Myxococcales bacterium]